MEFVRVSIKVNKMTKETKDELPEFETLIKPEKEEPKRMHSIILKEKDKDGNWLSLDVDSIFPHFPFGETNPMLMAIVDDKSYFIPLAQINWWEQNFGVRKDMELGKMIAEQKMKKMASKNDVSVM